MKKCARLRYGEESATKYSMFRTNPPRRKMNLVGMIRKTTQTETTAQNNREDLKGSFREANEKRCHQDCCERHKLTDTHSEVEQIYD